jgi:dipeptidyl aminopeptidase/acylaminoacyl peptidase
MKMRVVVAALVWVGVVAGLGQASGQTAKRPMTFADLMAMKRVSDPQISPSGKWVMFSVTDVSLEKNTKVNHLWVVALEGGGREKANTGILPSGQNDKQKTGDDKQSGERQVTFGDGESNGRFSPDGKWVSISMKDQIYLAPWDEAAGKVGEAKQLTDVAGGADGAVWSPDSKRLMFVAGVWPECSVKGSDPTHDGEAVMNGAPSFVVGGTRDVSAWKGAEPAAWAEEEACDKAKDDAAAASPVKGQVWDGLLYRHWDHYLGAKRSHVLVVSADGSGMRDLTPASVVGNAETPTFSLGGPLGYAWAPDSKEIAYVTNLDKVLAASTNNDVFTLRLDEPGAMAVKVSTSPGSDDEPVYSPDGKWLAFRSQARGGFESDLFRLMLFDREKKTIKELMPKWDRWVDEFSWAPDSTAIYFASGNHGEEQVFNVALAGEQPTENSATIYRQTNDGGTNTAFGAEFGDLHITPDGRVLVASGMTISSPSDLYRFELSQFPPEALHAVAPLEAWQRQNGGDIAAAKVVNMGVATLTRVNDDVLSQLDLPKMESFWFAGAEGTKVQGFILRPPGFDPAKKYPVKFLMHGGPQTAWGDGWSYRWNWELMAASGYVVVGINRRGSTGYGQKFVDEVSGDWGGRAYEDLMKGLDYAEAHYSFIDKTRECALGASYGGFMADWVLTHTNRFKCIVTHDGMYDPASAWGDTEEMWFNEWEFRRPEDFPKGWDGFVPTHAQTARVNGAPAAGGGTKLNAGVSPLHASRFGRDDDGLAGGHPAEPWRYQNLPADQDPFRKWSPMRFIENAKTPTLVIHSQKDYRLDVSQGMEMFTALQRLGVPSKFLYFPDEGHWVLKPQNSEMWNAVVGDWCDRWTKTGEYAEK